MMANADQARPWQENLYRDFHQHPELSHQEHRTAAAVAARLEESGFEVTTGVGGTGVVGIRRNGDGPTVLLRADMDALPVQEDTGLPYSSTNDGVAHACGHDMHTACLLGAADLLAGGEKHWSGTLIVVFQPAEETINGAQGMIDDGLAKLLPKVDVVLGQHVGPLPAGCVAPISGPAMAAADSVRVTVYGKGGHASMPQTTVDPVVLAATIVLRLQTIVSREIAPSDAAVVTVGSMTAGTKSNIIGDSAELLINIRTYSEAVRTRILDAVRRIVTAECQASNSPQDPEIEAFEHAPLTDNDPAVTARVATAFEPVFGDRVIAIPMVTGSEDFSDLANGVKAPYTFWFFGGVDPTRFAGVDMKDGLPLSIPSNHSPHFAPVIQPTLDTGTAALVAGALAWLAG
ncbi:MAG: amidohydrolase [Mycobacterium sp.]